MSSKLAPISRLGFFQAIEKHDPESTAVVHSLSGRTFKYGALIPDIAIAKERLLRDTGKNESSIVGQRVAFLVENGYDYVVTLLACLASQAIAVPLAPSFPPAELRFILNHSQSIALLSSPKFSNLAQNVLKEGIDVPVAGIELEKIREDAYRAGSVELRDHSSSKGGLMLFTSGTTGRPKGVLLPTEVLLAQCRSLAEAWDYSPRDRLLHVLPLHHIHGTVNALLTPLLVGSSIEFMFPFNVDHVWRRFATPFLQSNGHQSNGFNPSPITFFTVVPTIWARMLQSYPRLNPDVQQAVKKAIQRDHLRLNISGSAALPTPTKKAWTDLSEGNILLERYGMTEVGMALSCGLADEDRVDGSVGWPLPMVEARLVDPDSQEEITIGEDKDNNGNERPGEIQLRGPTIFKEYWNQPEATKKEFTQDGWFKTGDIAVRRTPPNAGRGLSGDWARGPAYFIHGRKSADIIKTGGEKVSALEVERELLSLPEVQECAVVALSSESWGQKVAAVIVLTETGQTAGKGGKPWGALDMRRALHDRLVAYKIPQDMKVVESIPRNAMGKVNKKELVPALFGDQTKIRRRSIEVAEERAKAKANAS